MFAKIACLVLIISPATHTTVGETAAVITGLVAIATGAAGEKVLPPHDSVRLIKTEEERQQHTVDAETKAFNECLVSKKAERDIGILSAHVRYALAARSEEIIREFRETGGLKSSEDLEKIGYGIAHDVCDSLIGNGHLVPEKSAFVKNALGAAYTERLESLINQALYTAWYEEDQSKICTIRLLLTLFGTVVASAGCAGI